MRSETQPYSTVIAIQLCRTAHAIFSPKFWNDKMNFTRVFVTVSPRRPWDRGWSEPRTPTGNENGAVSITNGLK